MPSTFTSNTGIELIADGEQSGAWGQTTNDNFDIIDRALNGSSPITLSGTTHTLTTSDGFLSDGQYAVVVFTGALSAPNTVTIAPNTAQKTYWVRNTTSEDVILSQGSGTNVTVPPGATKAVYADGAGASAAVVDLSSGFIPVLANAGVTATTAELNYVDVTALGTSEASKALTADAGGKVFINGAQRGKVVPVAALDIDCSSGNYFTKTISANSTFTFSNVPSGSSFAFTLELTHTSGTVTWPTTVRFPGNVAPILTTGSTHLFVFVTDDGGTRWRGAALVDYEN